MASRSDGYWARSKALLTREEGWIKPLLLLGAAQFVPIVGLFGASGYALEWGRLTAWGVDSAPKQRNVGVSSCIRSGARAFVAVLGYAFVWLVVRAAIGCLFGDTLGGLAIFLLSCCYSVFVTVVTLRATIYQSVGAGYEIGRIVDMVKRDYKGLLRIAGLAFVLALSVGLVVGAIFSVIMLGNMGSIFDAVMELERYGSYYDDYEIVALGFSLIGKMLPWLLVLGYVFSVLAVFVNLITTTSVALWMRQFDVQRWGASSDPLPDPVAGPASAGYGTSAGYGSATSYTSAASNSYSEGGTHEASVDTYATTPIPVASDPTSAPMTNEPQVSPLPMIVPQVVEPATGTDTAPEASAPTEVNEVRTFALTPADEPAMTVDEPPAVEAELPRPIDEPPAVEATTVRPVPVPAPGTDTPMPPTLTSDDVASLVVGNPAEEAAPEAATEDEADDELAALASLDRIQDEINANDLFAVEEVPAQTESVQPSPAHEEQVAPEPAPEAMEPTVVRTFSLADAAVIAQAQQVIDEPLVPSDDDSEPGTQEHVIDVVNLTDELPDDPTE